MPVAAIAAPVIAIGATAASAATVGITAAATIFAAVGAVGAVVGTVGYFTKSKELTIAGSILGGIGAIGGFASGMGLFGSGGGSLFGSGAEAATGAAPWATEMGQWATEVAPLASDAVTATAAPAGGYTLESLANSGLEGGLVGFGESGGVGMSNVDIIDLVNGAGVDNFNPLAPAEQIAEAQVAAPATEVLPDTTVAAAPQEPVLPEVAQQLNPDALVAEAQPPGLIDSAAPRDEFGNIIPQGGDPVGAQLGPGVGNPADATASSPGLINPPEATTPAATPASSTSTVSTDAGVVTGQPAQVPGQAAGATATGTTTPTPAAAGTLTPQQAANNAIIYGPNTGGITKVDASIWSRIFDMVEKRPTLALGALKAASSFISGAFSEGTTAEQRQAYAAQAEQNLAAANLARTQDAILQRRLRNMSDRIPVATSLPPPGLINSTVTGRPA